MPTDNDTQDLAGLNQGLTEPSALANPGGGSAFPGRVPGETRSAYKQWFEYYRADVSPWLDANPTRSDELQAVIWTYRNEPTKMRDEVLRLGFTAPGGGGTDGSGSRGSGSSGGASIAEQYASAEAAVRNRSRMLGLELDDGGIKALAKTVVDGKWSPDQLDDYMVPGAVNTNAPGMITATVNRVQQLAAQQLIRVSDASAREWAGRIASGEMDLAGVQSLLQAQAASKYTWAASQISQGISVRDMLLPARDRIASELELAPESVDLMDDKWIGMMQTVDDKGQTRASTDSEITMRARKMPEWSSTQRAGQAVAEYAATIRQYFGG